MAVAPPLVYADQAYSIVKKKQVLADIYSVVTPADTNHAQGLDRVLSGRLCNPVCSKFRTNPASSLIHLTRLSSFVRRLCCSVGKSSLVANITRCFFWLGDQFETPLLVQSILMILAQVRNVSCITYLWKLNPGIVKLALLYICIRFKPQSLEGRGFSTRPMSFWQWPTYVQHIEFLAGLMCVLSAVLTF